MSSQFIQISDFVAKWAAQFLTSKAESGGFPPYEGAVPNAMTTAEVISAHVETGTPFSSRTMHDAVNRLVEWQRADGSWTDPNSSDPWDVSSTAWAVLALSRFSYPLYSHHCRRGLSWLEAQIGSDGGLPVNAIQRTYNTYATSYTHRVMSVLEVKRAAEPTLKFLSNSQNSDGGWGLEPGQPSEATLTAYVLHGLIDGRHPDASKLIARGLSFLDHIRGTEGTWGSWLGEQQSVEGTAFCLYVRLCAGRQLGQPDLTGLQYIARRVEEGSAWQINGENQIWVAISVLLVAHQVRILKTR